jgi:hypothetical protein
MSREDVHLAGNMEVRKRGVPNFLDALLRFPCGALTLFNYPTSLRKLKTTDVYGRFEEMHSEIDLAAVDIYRDRERGVQRYNDFRRGLNMNPVKDWEELTGGDKVPSRAGSIIVGMSIYVAAVQGIDWAARPVVTEWDISFQQGGCLPYKRVRLALPYISHWLIYRIGLCIPRPRFNNQ